MSFRMMTALLATLIAAGCGDDDGASDTGAPSDAGTDTSTPGDSATDAPGDSSTPMDSSTPTDSGSADSALVFPDGGMGDPEWVDLTVGPAGTCTELTPCGGDIVGVWDVSGGCFQDEIDSTLEMCAGAMVTSRTGRGRGRVVFGADGLAERAAESIVEWEIFYPSLCATFFSCEMVEAAFAPFVDTISCPSEPGGDCTCTASLHTTIMDADRYRTEMNQIVSVTSGKRWDYCVAGDTLSYQDTDRSMTGEPGIVELSRP